MAGTMRTFIAVELDKDIRETIQHIQEHLKQLGGDVKWVKPENAHLTLKFLGDVPLKKIDAVKEVFQNLAKTAKPIDTQITQLGAFPKLERPRVIWVGLKDDRKEIEQFAASLDHQLGQIGFRKEERAFQSHITIGRVRSAKNLSLLSAAMKEYPLPADVKQSLSHVTLFKSTLTPHGPIYEVLDEIKLG